MLMRILFLLCLLLGGGQTASANVVRVADGDCDGLANAVSAASAAGSNTTIQLARAGNYPPCVGKLASRVDSAMDVSSPSGRDFSTNLAIDGQGARLQYVNLDVVHASLTLRNVVIGSATAEGSGGVACFNELVIDGIYVQTVTPVCNYGNLILESVTFDGLKLPDVIALKFPLEGGSPGDASLIGNSGQLVMRNVTISNIRPSVLRSNIIDNNLGGKVEVYNSTFANSQFGGVSGVAISSLSYRSDLPASSTTIANSLFAGNSTPTCDQAATSLGGNVAADATCGFSSTSSDRVALPLVLGAFANHGGLVPTVAIDGGGPAHGAGVAQYCEALDARGYTRSPHGCDAGAYEYGGGSGALTASGLNGFYFDPDANGHYVSLQRIHDNGDIAIVWSAFDASGNQAWVYGVGQLTNKHIHASMSQNIGGVLQAGGPPKGSSVRPWGTVDIDLTSCALAQFTYQSGLDGFGSGQFPLTRLAFVSDFGCSD